MSFIQERVFSNLPAQDLVEAVRRARFDEVSKIEVARILKSKTF
jgi:hypothetical protein